MMFAVRGFKLFALALTFTAACSTPDLDFPSSDAGPGGGNVYTPPVCDQECQDYGVGVALVDTIGFLYNQNIAHKPVPSNGFDLSVACPRGGNARITGTVGVSDGTTSVQLTYDLSACANSASSYDLTFDGSVVESGSFDGKDFAAVTYTGADLMISGSVLFLDDPSIDETCGVSVTRKTQGEASSLDGRVCGRNFSSKTAFDHVGGASGSGGAGGPSGSGGGAGGIVRAGGSGAMGASGSGCPSGYEGSYVGQFAYDYETPGPMPTTGTASFNLTLTLECTAVAAGQALLMITRANASHPYFGCGVGGCTPAAGSVAVLPAEPPTTPSNPSRIGAGLVVNFPNGVVLGTANQAGELNVTSSRTLSNALPSGMTWSAASLRAVSAFPGDGNRVTSFKSWNLSKSSL